MNGFRKYWGWIVFAVLIAGWLSFDFGPVVLLVLSGISAFYFFFNVPVWRGAEGRGGSCRNNSYGAVDSQFSREATLLRLVDGAGVMSNEPHEPIRSAETHEVPRTVDRVEAGVTKLRGVAKIVEPGRGHQEIPLFLWDSRGYLTGTSRYGLSVQPTVPERRQQRLGQLGRSLRRVQCRGHESHRSGDRYSADSPIPEPQEQQRGKTFPTSSSPGCAPLRRARYRLRRGRRSCLRPAPPALRRRAPTCG